MLVLTVVAIVALAILGIAFLQVARVQREVADDPIDNIDLVLDSVIEKIKVTLKEDVVRGGTLFGAGIEPYDYPVTNYGSPPVPVDGINGTVGNANFGVNDDAWLASTVPDFSVSPAVWPKITVLGGAYYLTDVQTYPLQRQLRNGTSDGDAEVVGSGAEFDRDVLLNDADLVDTDGDGIGDARYERAPIMVMTGREYFMAVRIIDASSLLNIMAATAITNDGVTTGNQVTGYFPTSLDMSRIAYKKTGFTTTGTAADVFDSFFDDQDLRDPCRDFSIIGGPGTAYPTPFGMTNLAVYDPSLRTSNPTLSGAGYGTDGFPGGQGQLSAWLDHAAKPGSLNAYSDALFELHWRGGVNNEAYTTQYETELGDAPGQFLGDPYDPDANPQPANYNDPIGYNNGSAAGVINAQRHFIGRGGGGNIANAGYIFTAIRHMLTTISGHAVYSPNYNNMHGGFALMGDLVYDRSGIGGNPLGQQLRADTFRNRLANPTAYPTVTGIFALGPGYPNSDPDNQLDAAAGYAAMIAEYSDADTIPTAAVEGAPGRFWYGLEPLPFLREVYIQVAYQDTDTLDSDPTTNPTDWQPVRQSHAILVEVGNPFDRPVRLDSPNAPLAAPGYDPSRPAGPNVRLAIFAGIGATEAALPLRTFELVDELGDDLTILPRDPAGMSGVIDREERIFYSNGSAAPAESGGTAGTDVNADLVQTNTTPPTNPVINMGFDWLDGVAGGEFQYGTEYTIALQVETPGPDGDRSTPADNVWVTYDRLTAQSVALGSGTDMTFPSSVDFLTGNGGVPTPPATKTQAYIQKSLRRSGRFFRYVSNRDRYLAAREPDDAANPNPSTWPGVASYRTNIDTIDGTDVKLTPGDASLDNTLQLASANRPIFSVAELGWIPMFGFMEDTNAGAPAGVGDFPQLLSGNDGTGSLPSGAIPDYERFLLFDDSAQGTDQTAVTITHADGTATNLSFAEVILSDFTTLHPGFDGQDNDGAGGADDAKENLVFGTMNINTVPEHLAILAAPYPGGLAQTRDMIQAIQPNPALGQGPVPSVGKLIKLINTTAVDPRGNPVYDLYPMPEETLTPASGGQDAERYAPNFPAENTMKKGQFLTQAFSVRSDVYIAFILVKGYTSGASDWSEPAESARAIVVFDRSGMIGSVNQDLVREVGRYRY